MQQALKEKLEKVVQHLNNAMVDPDIDIEYCFPEVEMTVANGDENSSPYIVVKYTEDQYLERKVNLSKNDLEKSAEDIANFVTFFIEQFKEEVDSLKYGPQ